MAILKYLFFQSVGDRRQRAIAIKNAVKSLELGMLIPMVKFETGRERQFYIGLAVQVGDHSVKGLSAEDNTRVNELARMAGLPRPLNPQQLCSAKEVRDSFLRGEIEWETFNESIRFEISSEPSDDLLSEQIADEPASLTSIDYDHLLWWASAMGEGSYGLLKQVIAQLPSFNEVPPWQATRKLVLLGHLEVSEEGHGKLRWGTTQTTFVLPEVGDAFLLGRRTPWLVSRIKEAIGAVNVFGQDGGPSRVAASLASVEASTEALGRLSVRIVKNPGFEWVAMLPDPMEFEASLSSDPDISEGRYSFNKWNGRGFNGAGAFPSGKGLYEVQRLTGSDSSTTRRAFFNGDRWVVGGYYDLRWLAMKAGEEQPRAYLSEGGDLLVPEVGRFPLAYERALVLCSGVLPGIVKDGDSTFLRYVRVGQRMASAFCDKLGIKLGMKGETK